MLLSADRILFPDADAPVAGFLQTAGDRIVAVGSGTPPGPADEHLSGIVVPGYVDVHCHEMCIRDRVRPRESSANRDHPADRCGQGRGGAGGSILHRRCTPEHGRRRFERPAAGLGVRCAEPHAVPDDDDMGVPSRSSSRAATSGSNAEQDFPGRDIAPDRGAADGAARTVERLPLIHI